MARGAKRPAPQDAGGKTGEAEAKRAKEHSIPQDVLDLLPELPASEGDLLRWLDNLARTLQETTFGLHPGAREWGIKRRAYALMEQALSRASQSETLTEAAATAVEQLIRSGYASTSRDRRALVLAGAWQLVSTTCRTGGREAGSANGSAVNGKSQATLTPKLLRAVQVYIHLAEHVSFYEDFTGKHEEFWSKENFMLVLEAMPLVVADFGEDLEADEWEARCPELEAYMKTLGRFLLFWTSGNDTFDFDVAQAMPLMEKCTEVFEKHDRRHGQETSAKVRGDFLEEVVRVSGVLAQLILAVLEEANGTTTRQKRAEAVTQAMMLLRFLVRVLMLKVPTFGPRAEGHSGPGNNMLPLDERQMDTDWIEGLWEQCQSSDAEDPNHPEILASLFRSMVDMPLEEQKYRLECVAPLVPVFISRYSEQLKQKEIPLELSDLKIVMNTVLQDDAFVNSEFMEEISFYPVLLEFATKRATIHAVCERVKLQMSSGDPIRLVVPRDNVLDGVCSSLNLQDQSARIDVPVEIEFKTGLVDSEGQELMDEGEDQGGLRRQWLDRASRHFLSSDLFRTPSSSSSSGAGDMRGKVSVPSPESVCKCVQDDWEEQFELFGCILGFALLHKDVVPVHFGHNFLRAVFGLKTGPQDLLPLLETVDKTLHTKVKYILDGGYSTIGDTLQDVLEQAGLPKVFTVDESHSNGLVDDTPLKADGDKIAVTEENKEEFVELFLDRILISGLKRQVECFRRGLLRVVPEEIVQRIAELMTLKEIEVMVCGADEVDVDDWEQHTQYENGYTQDSQPVRWFWEVVKSMTQESRAMLLSFATGSPQVPSGGFRFLQPEVHRARLVGCAASLGVLVGAAIAVPLRQSKWAQVLELDMHALIQYKEHMQSLQDYSTYRNAKNYMFAPSPSTTPMQGAMETPLHDHATPPLGGDDFDQLLPPAAIDEMLPPAAVDSEGAGYQEVNWPMSGGTARRSSGHQRSARSSPAMSASANPWSGTPPMGNLASPALSATAEPWFPGGAEAKQGAAKPSPPLSPDATAWYPPQSGGDAGKPAPSQAMAAAAGGDSSQGPKTWAAKAAAAASRPSPKVGSAPPPKSPAK